MAKNFTDFQQVTDEFVNAGFPDSHDKTVTGTTTTQANKDMWLVGYDVDEPHGERQYTIESVLLAASSYHVGLENVDNRGTADMLDNSNLTGYTSAEDMYIHGNLHVEGTTVELNTESFATSAFNIINSGTKDALFVKQTERNTIYNVAQFWAGSDIGLEINSRGNVGIKTAAGDDPNTALTISGNISAHGELFITGEVDGRHVYEDGLKLDNIQNYADVTSYMLSSVYDRLDYLSTTAPYAGITPARGFDLLEDGDTYTKTPAASSQSAPGIGDFSIEKLKSVEYEADVTGDHSHDIIFNDVPDGPWTGDATTTHVKATSAELDRLTSVRGVSASLYNLDDGVGDIDRDDIRQAYQQAYPDFWSSDDEIEYRNTVIPAASASVQNIGNEILPAGQAKLETLEVTDSTTLHDVVISSKMSVVSGGQEKQGLTTTVDVGGWIFTFVDGILVDLYK